MSEDESLNFTEPPADERQLIEEAKTDPSRFGDLYERYFDRVYAYVSVRVRRRADAEDLASEVFRRALKALPRYEWRGVPFSAWLFRIAANAVASGRSADAPPFDEVELAANDAGQEEALVDAERRGALFGAVRELPNEQRRVVALRFSEEKSIRETARILQKSEGAIKQLQFRALRNLRARMGEIHG